MNEERLLVAGRAARDAGKTILPLWRDENLTVTTKTSVTDLVSEADFAAQSICQQVLSEAFPDDGLISEEGLDVQSRSGFTWAIDPLDGTTNFVHGIGHWAVVISGWENGQAVMGAVCDPVRGELFCCAQGQPLTRNGEQVPVRDARPLEASVWATGFTAPPGRSRRASFADAVLTRVGHVRSMGSLGLDLAWTACGRFDAFMYECSLRPWVHGAGMVMCERQGMRMMELPATDRFAAALAVVPGSWTDLVTGT